jgi:hypothetical protein
MRPEPLACWEETWAELVQWRMQQAQTVVRDQLAR